MTLVILRDEAVEDIVSTFADLEAARPGIGKRFVKRMREILTRIEQLPEIYAIVWQDVRAVRVKNYRHVLYYIALEERVEVLGVIHGSRDAAIWRARR